MDGERIFVLVNASQTEEADVGNRETLQYGGDWTVEKLERVRKYLRAYTVALKNQRFHLLYIDAFAGTGYCSLKRGGVDERALRLPELAEPETQEFLPGSARIALEVEPPFSEFIFIEKDSAKCAQLHELEHEFASKRDRITVVSQDANEYIGSLCQRSGWSGTRAVLFLDPYGMQVSWQTVRAVAETQAIDLWYLFPLGVAVNRLMRKDGNIRASERRKLDEIFGAPDWYEAFYESKTARSLFGDETFVEKQANFKSIGEYLVARLKTAFPGVAENPLPLLNERNVPLYLLCFAAANKRGAPIAVKIAQHILKG